MKEFLVKSSQLEVLKLEWGMKMLRLHSVVTQGHAELLESAYKDKVMSWVRKMVAKQQMRDLARMQAESVSGNSFAKSSEITGEICIRLFKYCPNNLQQNRYPES